MDKGDKRITWILGIPIVLTLVFGTIFAINLTGMWDWTKWVVFAGDLGFGILAIRSFL